MSDKPIKIDKELYRQAREWYREMNVAEDRERYRTAGERSPGQGWQEYLSLWEFCMNLSHYPPSERQQKQRMADWERYYERIQKFEEWRRQRGTAT